MVLLPYFNFMNHKESKLIFILKLKFKITYSILKTYRNGFFFVKFNFKMTKYYEEFNLIEL